LPENIFNNAAQIKAVLRLTGKVNDNEFVAEKQPTGFTATLSFKIAL